MEAKELRASARKALKGGYWKAFWFCLLVCVLMGLSSVFLHLTSAVLGLNSDGEVPSGMDVAGLVLLVLAIIAGILKAPISVGMKKYFISLFRNGKAEKGAAFSMMGKLWRCFWLEILIGIKTFLWSLLFIIPGIIAAINYSQAKYVLAENPDLKAREAIDRSKHLMKGHKWDYVYLCLTFIGWLLLCIVTCGIGLLFLAPYLESAFAAFYFDRKGSLSETGVQAKG